MRITLIDFFRPAFFFFRETSKMTFVRKNFFIDLSILSKEVVENDYVRRNVSSIVHFSVRNKFYDRIFIRKSFLRNVDSTIEKFFEDFLMFHVFMMIERVDRIKKIMHVN